MSILERSLEQIFLEIYLPTFRANLENIIFEVFGLLFFGNFWGKIGLLLNTDLVALVMEHYKQTRHINLLRIQGLDELQLADQSTVLVQVRIWKN